MIRLAHIITDLGHGGAQTALALLIARTRQRFEHHVVSLRALGPGRERFSESAGLTALDMRPGRASPWAGLRLRRRLAEIAPQLAVTWLYHADLIGGLAARAVGLPVCWNVRHGAPDPQSTRAATRIVVRLCAALARRVPSAIVYNSRRSQAAHEALGYDARRSRVIPNGVDPLRFRPDGAARAEVRRELGIAEGAPLLGIVGRYCADKDFDTFAECAARVARARPDARFVACGAGVDADNAALGEALARRNLSARTHRLGLRRDVPRVLAALDLMVCSSRTEAFPNAVLEALACGVPCVSTDVGEVRDVLGRAGIVVPVGDAEGLAQGCLAGLAARPALAQQARPRALRFSVDSMAERHAQVWESLARRASRAAA